MLKEPNKPWVKGLNEDYAMFRLEIDVCVTKDQDVFSEHRPQDQTDVETMKKLYSYGEQQTIFSLLTEALRREAFFEILIRMSDDPNFLDSYISQDEGGKHLTEKDVSKDVIELFHRTINNMTPDVVKNIFHMMDQKQKVE